MNPPNPPPPPPPAPPVFDAAGSTFFLVETPPSLIEMVSPALRVKS